jgi:cysteine desulfurase
MPVQERSYLDWNASTPLRPEARRALVDALNRFGNPSSPHAEGREARDLVESAREEVAGFLGCEPVEVVFTSGGTEANNLALASLAARAANRFYAASRIEHPSVLRPLESLELAGWRSHWLRVDEDGRIDPSGLDADVGFGAIQAANHETGALQPIAAFAEAFASRGIPWHCDAVQAWGRIALVAREAGCATASLSGHKLGGPKGVGVLYVRRGTELEPVFTGGPQERERRAGTENVPGIAALAAACRSCSVDFASDTRWMAGLRDRLVAGALEVFPLAWLNGPEDPSLRLPNTANLSFPGLKGEVLVQALDLEGVAVSSGSACTSGAVGPSEVLRAMDLPGWRVEAAIRASLGPATTPEDVDRFLLALEQVTQRLKK